MAMSEGLLGFNFLAARISLSLLDILSLPFADVPAENLSLTYLPLSTSSDISFSFNL